MTKGIQRPQRILKYDTIEDKWKNTSIQLEIGRFGHRCMIFNDKVIVTGGVRPPDHELLSSTEIIEFGKNGELTIRKGPNMPFPNYGHGTGIITLDRIPTLIVLGGHNSYSASSLIYVWHEVNNIAELNLHVLKTQNYFQKKKNEIIFSISKP